ncbi:MAG TPA: hypothetical protein EYQ31_09795 [Candidatus Handelsmanbacteria bacterium]|nr:hypothetical protein [Candidatus Handelsmanbacteria bacterium]
MRKSAKLALVLGAMCLMSTAAFAHVGVTVFYPEVPDPAAITIDGNDNDWGWFDPALALNQPDFFDRASDAVALEDYDFTILNGWSRSPDNMWYGFARFVDDTLKYDSPVKEWWKDDCLQITVDADHQGGGILGETLEEIGNGQRWHVRVFPPAGEALLPAQTPFFYSQLEFFEANELLWAVQPGLLDAAWTVLPAGAENLSTGVIYTYEWKMALWDIWGLTEEESIRHELAVDDVIHLGYRPIDADRPGSGRKHSMYINDGSQSQDVDASQMPDFWALESDGNTGTAVENQSWGHIKNRMSQRLMQ